MSAHTTERAHTIHVALSVLLNPEIPYEHEKDDHNCGECWQCIYGTIVLANVLIEERDKPRRAAQ